MRYCAVAFFLMSSRRQQTLPICILVLDSSNNLASGVEVFDDSNVAWTMETEACYDSNVTTLG